MTEDPKPPPQPIHVYTDEHGREIRVYPPRYAENVWVQPCTAKPSSRRGRRE